MKLVTSWAGCAGVPEYTQRKEEEEKIHAKEIEKSGYFHATHPHLQVVQSEWINTGTNNKIPVRDLHHWFDNGVAASRGDHYSFRRAFVD